VLLTLTLGMGCGFEWAAYDPAAGVPDTVRCEVPTGLRPYVHEGGGQVRATTESPPAALDCSGWPIGDTIHECTGPRDPYANPEGTFACIDRGTGFRAAPTGDTGAP